MTAAVESPWMSVAEAAQYARRHHMTVQKALWRYVRTNGREGLKGGQSNGANSVWSVHRDDVDTWLRGNRPCRRTPAIA